MQVKIILLALIRPNQFLFVLLLLFLFFDYYYCVYVYLLLLDTIKDAHETLVLLLGELDEVRRDQHYMLKRSKTHTRTTESTNRRVLFWSVLEAVLLVSVASFQVFWVRRMLEKKRAI